MAMRLTDREKEILDRVANGEKQEAIAAALQIHVKTVEFHLRHVREKLSVSSTLAAIVLLALKTSVSPSYRNRQLTLFD